MQPWTEIGLRTAVLDATRHLLVQDGYEAVSMRKVAAAVGCSVSSIYLHFPNKDALIHALMDEGFERWYGVAQQSTAGAESPFGRLDALCHAYVEFGLKNPEYYEIMYMFHPERLARFPRDMYRRSRRPMDLTTEIVQACAPERFATRADARIAANVLWAVLHGAVSTILAGRLDSRVDRAAYLDASVAYAVSGVRKLAPPGVRPNALTRWGEEG